MSAGYSLRVIEVESQELEPGDQVVRIREEAPCCGHPDVRVTVARTVEEPS